MGKKKDVEILWRGNLNDLQVILDQTEGVFHAGLAISGHVIVDLKEPMKVRNVHVLLFGESQVRWLRPPFGRHKRYTDFEGTETYLNVILHLIGSGEGEILHPAGRHSYRFSYQLPETLPTSVEGGHGYVRYYCKATIHNPWLFDYDCKNFFTVLGRLDLNVQPGNLKAPIRKEGFSKVSCCCCISGDVKASFSTDRGAYVPGENIIVNAEITNASNSTVTGSSITLKQYTEFLGYSNSPTTSGGLKPTVEVSVLAEKTGEKVKQHEIGKLDNVSLRVPAVPPSQLLGCNIINTAYEIKLHVKVKNGSDIELPVVLLIGTVPFHQQTYGAPLGYAMAASSAAPPAYEECVSGRRNLKGKGESDHTRGQFDWAPRYPTYTMAANSDTQNVGPLYQQI